jgi:hypothetical protein
MLLVSCQRTVGPPLPQKQKRQLRAFLDGWFPTISRYAGLALLGYSGVFDHFTNPALLTAAVALTLTKSVLGKGD